MQRMNDIKNTQMVLSFFRLTVMTLSSAANDEMSTASYLPGFLQTSWLQYDHMSHQILPKKFFLEELFFSRNVSRAENYACWCN